VGRNGGGKNSLAKKKVVDGVEENRGNVISVQIFIFVL
jgi:hypothetical protein